ncbi:hypothetical protein MSNKSG1_14192 [Marinobacter santoriniensis NKSG1]|uniref:Uncharacterized protein n=1 Tax=Marinobacter santoriniensis NKSG1 TaxID=1288826 RepID=M7D2C0_9GAMM|nr:hypothetical protein MSNKSG1_14192 [Marinobacter santoriniensis NKSG1]
MRAFLVASLLWAGVAYGHGGGSEEGKGTVRAVLDPLPPELSALRVQLRRTLAPQLLVANPTDKPLTVADEQGRTFLRIGPEQTEGDLGAAAFHRSNTLMAPGTIPADASGEPRWTVVEATPNWGWFDLRLRTSSIDVPHQVVDAGERVSVGQWSVPVRLGETETAISGHFEYVPTAKGIAQAQVVDAGALKGQALVRAMPGSARPGLFVSYRGDAPVTLMGAQDEPFLRFSSQGVEANLHSPTWARVAPAGSRSFTEAIDDADVRWAKISNGRSYGWIEPRAAYADTVEDPTRTHVVKRWQIPILMGDKSSRIEGVTRWVPVESVAAN